MSSSSAMSGPPFDASIHLRTRTPGPKEQDLINQFRVQLKASCKNYVAFESWLTDETLHRFLIARQYSVVKAVKLIESALVWREKRNPNRFLPRPGPKFEALFEVEMTTGKMYIAGFDRWGRTVIVFNNTVQNTTSHNDQMDFLSWLLETAILLSASRSPRPEPSVCAAPAASPRCSSTPASVLRPGQTPQRRYRTPLPVASRQWSRP